MKVEELNDSNHGFKGVMLIFCPGCKYLHRIDTKPGTHPQNITWDFNGDFEKPTFSPSLLVNKDSPDSRCHSFIRDGKIEFLSDSYHELKGKTVDLPEVEL